MGVPSGMPLARTCRLRYTSSKQFDCASQTVPWNNFAANGIYDPDLATGGEQPMGFDQWAALFNHYIVKGAKITMYVSYDDLTASSLPEPCVVGILLSDSISVPYTDWKGLVECGKGSHRFIGTMGGPGITKVVAKFSARKFFNIKSIRDNTRNTIGSVNTANPTDLAVFICWGQQTNAAAITSQKLNVNFIIDYIVEWSEPKEIGRS